MKKTKIFALKGALLAVTAAFLIAGCSSKNNVNEPVAQEFDSPQFALIDMTDANNAIEDATLSKEITVNHSFADYTFLDSKEGFMPGGRMMRGHFWMEHFDFGKHLGRVFRQLNLSDEQKNSLHIFLKSFHESMKPLVKQFFDANKSIIDDANNQRKLILEDLKSGKITKTEAETKLKELNKAVRDKIAANPESQKIKEDMCKLRTDLFSSIRSVLSAEQISKWEDMISKLKNPCA